MQLPEAFVLTFAFLFGLIGGSFLNALLFRLNTGKGMGGRSRCTSCGRELSALDLIPVLSYLILRGKCRSCKTRISVAYPLVELAGGALVALVWFVSPDPFSAIIGSLAWLILLAIAVYDLRHLIIPDAFAVSLSLIALGALLFPEGQFTLPDIAALLAGPALALPLFLIWLFSRGRWMGLGDAKLMLGLGWLLGPIEGAVALILSFWVGAIISLLLLSVTFEKGKKRLTMRSEVPLGPFLIAGAAIVYFTNVTEALLAALFFT